MLLTADQVDPLIAPPVIEGGNVHLESRCHDVTACRAFMTMCFITSIVECLLVFESTVLLLERGASMFS